MIIGITGTFAAGKDTIADYLVNKKGFGAASFGDIVREYVKKYNWENTRENQMKMGNKLRDEFGADFLLKEALKRVENPNKVVAGARQMKEAEYFTTAPGAILISVDALIDVRFERIAKRSREGDPKTIQELQEKENQEMHGGDGTNPNCQNIAYCMSIANYKIINDGSFEELYKKVDEIIEKLENR